MDCCAVLPIVEMSSHALTVARKEPSRIRTTQHSQWPTDHQQYPGPDSLADNTVMVLLANLPTNLTVQVSNNRFLWTCGSKPICRDDPNTKMAAPTCISVYTAILSLGNEY